MTQDAGKSLFIRNPKLVLSIYVHQKLKITVTVQGWLHSIYKDLKTKISVPISCEYHLRES